MSDLDELIRASQRGPLLVRFLEYLSESPRLAAHVFGAGGGVVFVDPGWSSPRLPKHPIHRLEGRVIMEDPVTWDVRDKAGKITTFIVDELNLYPEKAADWARFLEWAASDEGQRYGSDRAAALRAARAEEGIGHDAYDLEPESKTGSAGEPSP